MSDSQANSTIAKTALIAGGVAAVAMTGVAAYCSYKKLNEPPKGFNDYFELAENKKKDGIECFRYKDYKKAIKLFDEAVWAATKIDNTTLTEFQLEAIKNLIANCNNNLSACYESLDDVSRAICYCDEAIKIHPHYVKSLKRRARLNEKANNLVNTIHDLFTLTALCTAEDEILTLTADIDRTIQKAVLPELTTIMSKSDNVHKSIPQYVVANWLWNTVIHDPIVKRCEQLKNQTRNGIPNGSASISGKTLDDALILINEGKYDEVSAVLEDVIESISQQTGKLAENVFDIQHKSTAAENECENPDRLIEKSRVKVQLWDFASALYTLARFLHFHNRTAAAREHAKQFNELWLDSVQSIFKAETVDEEWVALRVAYFTLCIALAETDAEAQMATDEAVRIAPYNTDPLMALAVRHLDNGNQEAALNLLKGVVELQPNHPYATYYIYYLDYVISLKAEAIARVRAHIDSFDRYLRSTDPPPFAKLLFVKVCINSENADLATSTLKEVIEAMPNNAYALYLFGIMDGVPTSLPQEPEKIRAYVNKVEQVMYHVLTVDPNYWEPYRTLAKIQLDRLKFDEALENYDKAIALARTRSDIESILKDKLTTHILVERAKDGRGMPLIIPDAQPIRTDA